MTASLLDRIVTKLDTDGECWSWVGAKNDSGYGMIVESGKSRRVHRVLYELVVGPIPQGLELDHLCANRCCANPDHLEPVTHAENMARYAERNKGKTHCRHGHSNEYRSTAKDRRCLMCHLIVETKRGHPTRRRKGQ